MKCRPILVDDTLRELTQHGTPDFPLSMDRQVVADPYHGGVRHWHPEVQIALVTEGEVLFRAARRRSPACRTGLFVNGGVLHEAAPQAVRRQSTSALTFFPASSGGPATGWSAGTMWPRCSIARSCEAFP